MRLFLIVGVLVSAASIPTITAAQSAQAMAPPPNIQIGERIYSADGAVIGRVQYVDKGKDGMLRDVAVIHEMRMVHIPADSLSTGPNGVTTSLKRSDVSKLD
jgi:hypothetical protein